MSNSPNRKNHNNNPSPDDDWIGELIVGLLKAAGYLLWWAILFPSLSIPTVVAIWVGFSHGARAGVLTAVVEAVAYLGWWVCQPASFTRWVSAPLRQRFWAWWRYHRNWESVCALHGLTAKLGERTLVPALQSVRIGHHADVLIVKVVTGQSIADWQKRALALAATWDAQRLTIRATTPGQLRIIIGPRGCARPADRGAHANPRVRRSIWARCGSGSPNRGAGGTYRCWASTSWPPVPPEPAKARCCGR
ncbi:hypothetical protein MSAS_39990 [Mycobacterium saskatchewanense]|nr:hypothetical protein MSAS_39990 [Mycobacterium saskatchewanense]